MFDPFAQWRRYAAAGESWQATGIRASRTMDSASDVFAKRSVLIGEAVVSPWTADYVELGRMLPEKLEAVARAASATGAIWLDAQSAWLTYMEHLGAMTVRGRPPTPSEFVTLGERGATLFLRSTEATAKLGAAALAPFSRQVGVNVRRLESRKRTRSRRKGKAFDA